MTTSRTHGGIVYAIPAYPPLASQPFVVNEMLEVARSGRPLVVLPLRPGTPEPVRHGTYEALRPTHVLPARLIDVPTVVLAAVALVRWPRRVLGTLGGLARAAGTNPWAQLRLAAVTPKALAGAWRLRHSGITHVHAHFANTTADAAAILARTLGVPFSFTAHAYDIYSTAPRLRNATLRWKVRAAARVIAISDYGAGLLRAFLPSEAAGRVRTVHVGIPLDLFRATPLPPAPPLRLLSVARWLEKKGLDTLLDACALLREQGVAFSLRVFGDGPLRPALEAQCARLALGPWVTLGGGISQEAVAEALRECHVFILPCRRDRTGDMDGIPTVFMEAMATGRPVVSCAVSGIPELVRHGETGLLAVSDDAASVAAAVAQLAADPAAMARLGAQGRALVEQEHDQRTCARAVLAALDDAAS